MPIPKQTCLHSSGDPSTAPSTAKRSSGTGASTSTGGECRTVRLRASTSTTRLEVPKRRLALPRERPQLLGEERRSWEELVMVCYNVLKW